VTENLSSVFKELKIRGQIFLVKFYLKWGYCIKS
jgi:hypothetical protein